MMVVHWDETRVAQMVCCWVAQWGWKQVDQTAALTVVKKVERMVSCWVGQRGETTVGWWVVEKVAPMALNLVVLKDLNLAVQKVVLRAALTVAMKVAW